jgi:hypothetical protein
MTQKQPENSQDKRQVHSGYAEVTRYKERGLDMRRRDDRALKAFQDNVINDLGGPSNVDTFQLAMLDRATEALIILRCMAEHVEGHGVIDGKGNLAPCLRQSYISYLNSFRHTMASIYERGDKRGPKAPSLKDILNGSER